MPPFEIRHDLAFSQPTAIPPKISRVCNRALQPVIEKFWRLSEYTGSHARTVTLKVKYSDFRTATRSHTDPLYIGDHKALDRISNSLLECLFPVPKGIRLLGITLPSFQQSYSTVTRQLELALDM